MVTIPHDYRRSSKWEGTAICSWNSFSLSEELELCQFKILTTVLECQHMLLVWS